jgi:hypothetical protein
MEWIIGKLVENAERAMKLPRAREDDDEEGGEFTYQGSVANRALELLGKELGMFIDRKEVGKPGDFDEDWAIKLPSLTKDKVARAHTAEPSFAADLFYAPDTEWAEKVIAQAETFPKSKFKHLVDSTTQAVTWMRKHRLIAHNREVAAELREQMMHPPKEKPLYDV